MERSDISSPSHFRVDILLADVVRLSERKLDALGIGWQVHTPGAPIGVGILIEVPWDQANRKHHFSLALEDADGHSVMVPTPEDGFAPFRFEFDFEVGRPPGVQPGTPLLTVPLPMNFPPNALGLHPGRRYTFRASIGNQTSPDWARSFGVQAAPMQKAS